MFRQKLLKCNTILFQLFNLYYYVEESERMCNIQL